MRNFIFQINYQNDIPYTPVVFWSSMLHWKCTFTCYAGHATPVDTNRTAKRFTLQPCNLLSNTTADSRASSRGREYFSRSDIFLNQVLPCYCTIRDVCRPGNYFFFYQVKPTELLALCHKLPACHK